MLIQARLIFLIDVARLHYLLSDMRGVSKAGVFKMVVGTVSASNGG